MLLSYQCFSYQAQHQAFVSHAMQQILGLQQQKQSLETQATTAPPNIPQNIPPSPAITAANNLAEHETFTQNNSPVHINPPPPLIQQPQQSIPNLSIPPNLGSEPYLPPINPSLPPPNLAIPPNLSQPPNGLEHQLAFTQPPPGFLPGGFPDFSKPPPGFPLPPKPEILEEFLPTEPYYNLPAGLMIPLIKASIYKNIINLVIYNQVSQLMALIVKSS